jgi:hypothetical protein
MNNVQRNLSVPRMGDLEHPILAAPTKLKPLEPIDHTNFHIKEAMPHTTVN